MKDKVFIDTNVMLYAYSDTEEHKRQVARELIVVNYTVVSTQVLQEFANILNRKFNIKYPIIRKAVEESIQNNNIVHTNKKSTIFKAFDIAARYGFSFYDSLIIASAIESNCSILFTEDLQHNQNIDNVLTIINPFLA